METENHEYYVSPEVAKLLKEAGFDRKITSYYVRYYEGDGNDDSTPTDEFRLHISDNTYCTDYNNTPLTYINGILHKLSAPTLEVAQRWLREVKGIHICVKPNEATANCKYFVTVIVNDTKWGNVQDDNKKTIMFDTYEEAQESGINKALDIILEAAE